MRVRKAAVLAALSCCLVESAALAEDTNDANNPLTPKITLNLQDYYTPSFFGVPGRDANSFLLRGLVPAKIAGIPQLFRFTLPLATASTFPRGYDTGLGDLTLMDLFVLPGKPVTFAAGPILVAPTSTSDATGAGRWQLGAAGIAISPQSWGLLGGLLTYQHSFADSFGRDAQSLLTFEPIIFYNLPDQLYLRSSATWNFDFQHDSGYIPLGLGLGKVWQISQTTTMNAYIEPQYTVYHYGSGTPHWQIFGGVNFQFALGGGAAKLPTEKPKS